MVQTVTLQNGVQIVLEKLPFVRSVALGIWVKNGSRNESPETMGISHFIEHMLFKGTHTRSAFDIADEMDAIGGQMNAFTTKECTCYYTVTLDSHVDKAMDVLADMFFNSKFDNEEIQKECGVILEEISMYEDAPDDLVHDILQQNIWQGNTLGYPVLGDANVLTTFNHDTFVNYHKARYVPKNTVIAVVGQFDEDSVVQKLEEAFGSFQGDAPALVSTPADFNPGIVTKDKDIEQMHLAIGFPGIPLKAKDTYALTALNTIFGGGMSSRLFQTIRETHGLAYAVYSYASAYTDTGLLTIYAGLNPAQTGQVFKLVFEEIKKLLNEPISEKQLNKTKEQLKSNYFLSLESTSARMNSVGKAKLLLGEIRTPEYITGQIDALTPKILHDLANKVLDLSAMSVAAVGPMKGMDMAELVEKAK